MRREIQGGKAMQKILLMSVLLTASLAFAQYGQTQTPSSNPSASQSQSQMGTSNQISVQGCLSGSDGNYTLTDKSGNSYQLTAGNVDLKSHVGQQVQISGSATPAAGGTAGTSGTAGTTGTTGTTGAGSAASQANQVTVDTVSKISDTCGPSR
jgi:type IV secretory pathway TrbL component